MPFEVSSSLHSAEMTQPSGSLDFLVVGLQFFLFVLPCIQLNFEVSTYAEAIHSYNLKNEYILVGVPLFK